MIPYRMNPLGISVTERMPLTFTAVSAGSTVTLNATGSPTVSGLHYRLGKSGIWLPYTIGTTVTLANVGDSVQFWNSATALSIDTGNFVQFSMSGAIEASGTIQALLNFSKTCYDNCFFSIMRGCASMITPPEFSATTTGSYCYYRALRGCSSLVSSPAIPAKILSDGSCYEMCRDCSNMTSAGKIKSVTLGAYSLAYMFYNCPDLTEIEVNFLSWSGTYITQNWVSGVVAEGTFIKPTALPEEYGPNRIPSGWTVVNK